MSSQFKYHSQVDEVVPWQATYTFPTQATKVNKQTVKIVPKNGSSYTSGNIIRLELPSDNYLNVLNSYLQMDLQFNIVDTTDKTGVYSGCVATCGTNTATYLNLLTWTGTSGVISDTVAGAYAGYTIAVTRPTTTNVAPTTFYSTIAAHSYYATGTVTELWLSQPLPIVVAVGDYITIIPPYSLQRGGAQNLIKRLRIMYGSLVLEDILEYKSLVRIFYEAGVDPGMASGSGNILECMAETRSTPQVPTISINEALQSSIVAKATTAAAASPLAAPGATIAQYQALCGALPSGVYGQLAAAPAITSTGTIAALTATPYSSTSGRTTVCLNLLSGLLTQKKLLPLKWMASQLAIEITLSTDTDCIIAAKSASVVTYGVSNVNLVCEMLEFDSAYDAAFYGALQTQGIPIKFSSFHYHTFSLSGSYNVVQIHERARSVKAAYAVARDTNATGYLYDSDRFFASLYESWTTATGLLADCGQGQITQFQWRVGGRYYPAQPVRCIYGASEALCELQKALDMLGDYTRQGGLLRKTWTINNGGNGGSFIIAAPFENTGMYYFFN